jgi:hypothetical protein
MYAHVTQSNNLQGARVGNIVPNVERLLFTSSLFILISNSLELLFYFVVKFYMKEIEQG